MGGVSPMESTSMNIHCTYGWHQSTHRLQYFYKETLGRLESCHLCPLKLLNLDIASPSYLCYASWQGKCCLRRRSGLPGLMKFTGYGWVNLSKVEPCCSLWQSTETCVLLVELDDSTSAARGTTQHRAAPALFSASGWKGTKTDVGAYLPDQFK